MDHVLVSGGGFGPAIAAPIGLPEPGHCVYVPRMDLRESGRPDGSGSFGAQVYRWAVSDARSGLNVVSFSSMAPRPENRIRLHPERRDAYGTPVLTIDCRVSAGEIATAERQSRAIAELADICDVKLTWLDRQPRPPGAAIHECGVARMGTSPDSSVLDPFNQCWDAPGLYLTDAAAFPSLPLQNPTLTSMALTARAVVHALRARGVTPTAAEESVRPESAPLAADSAGPA